MRRELVTVGIDVITLELGMSPAHMPWYTDKAGLVKTAMSAHAKDFDLEYAPNSPRRSTLFTRYPAIIDTVAREFRAETDKAPTAEETAVEIVKAIEKSSSPRKIWLGRNWGLFKYLFPYLPTKAADALWSKVMRTDLMA